MRQVKRGAKRAAAFAAALLFMEAAPGAAQSPAAGGGSLALGGSIEARPFASYAGTADLSGPISLGSATTLELGLRARGPMGGAVMASAEASGEAFVLSGAAATTSPDESLVALRLRTLWVKLDAGWASLSLGRQALSYGRGAYWSPVDIYTTLDASGVSPVKRGVDAIRAKAPLGATGSFDLVAVPRAAAGAGRYSARLSGLIGGVDCGLLAARDGAAGSWLGGADFKLDLGLGLYGEALYSLPDSGGVGSLMAAGGADYSIGELYLAAEYYYSQAGTADPYKAGSSNAYAALSWALSDFLRLTVAGLMDIAGGRGSCTAILAWDAAQGAILSVYAKAARTGLVSLPWAADGGMYLSLRF